MNVPQLRYEDFLPVIPACILIVGAVVVLLSEVFLSTAQRTYQSIIAVLTAAGAGMWATSNAFEPAHKALQGYVVLDPFSSWTTVIACLGTVLTTLLAVAFLQHRNAERGEFYALILFAAAGMSLLAMSAEFITLFISLEVLSLATYALTAFLRRGLRSSEAGFKYFLLGAFSASLLLYGAALLYGATGSTHFSEISTAMPAAFAEKPGLVYAGLGLVFIGFAFKVAAVPFHMWAPDVYEGAPSPVTALMSASVKAAAVVAMVRTFLFIAKGLPAEVIYLAFGTLALLSMVVGNLLALSQRNVKRMLAYSSIAHAGYLLLGIAALFAPRENVTATAIFSVTPLAPKMAAFVYKGILFYLLGYTVTAIGAFGTIALVERREGENAWDLDRFAGLAKRAPGKALAMTIFMLSFGGIPPTVGFLGKVYLFGAAIRAGLLTLTIIGILASVIGVAYYLRVVVYMYMQPEPADAPVPLRHWTSECALVLSAVGVVVLGVIPGTLTEWLSRLGMIFGT